MRDTERTLADRLLLRNHIVLRRVVAAVALAVVNSLPIIHVG